MSTVVLVHEQHEEVKHHLRLSHAEEVGGRYGIAYSIYVQKALAAVAALDKHAKMAAEVHKTERKAVVAGNSVGVMSSAVLLAALSGGSIVPVLAALGFSAAVMSVVGGGIASLYEVWRQRSSKDELAPVLQDYHEARTNLLSAFAEVEKMHRERSDGMSSGTVPAKIAPGFLSLAGSVINTGVSTISQIGVRTSTGAVSKAGVSISSRLAYRTGAYTGAQTIASSLSALAGGLFVVVNGVLLVKSVKDVYMQEVGSYAEALRRLRDVTLDELKQLGWIDLDEVQSTDEDEEEADRTVSGTEGTTVAERETGYVPTMSPYSRTHGTTVGEKETKYDPNITDPVDPAELKEQRWLEAYDDSSSPTVTAVVGRKVRPRCRCRIIKKLPVGSRLAWLQARVHQHRESVDEGQEFE